MMLHASLKLVRLAKNLMIDYAYFILTEFSLDYVCLANWGLCE